MSGDVKSTWKAYKLDQLGFVGRGRSRHRPRNDPAMYDGQYPFFQTGDIKAAGLYLRQFTQTYNDSGLAQSRLWEPGALCITIAANIAETAILGIPGCFPDSVVGFVADGDKADARFIKYYIDLIKLRMQAISGGTTQDNLSLDKLLTFDFVVPDVGTQRRIASILSAYDRLIEDNLGRIRILDEMAQAIYQEWFVNLRFPGHEKVKIVDSPLGRIPGEWRPAQLADHAKFDKGVSYSGRYLTPDGLPMVNLKCVRPEGGFKREGVKPYSGAFRPQHTVRAGDLVIANTDLTQAGRVIGSPGVVPRRRFEEGGLASHHMFIARRLRGSPLGVWYLYHLLCGDAFRAFARGRASGTTVLGLRSEDAVSFVFAQAPVALVDRFEDFASPLHELAERLSDRNELLMSARDLLLPKLISGELDVSDLEIPMPEVAA